MGVSTKFLAAASFAAAVALASAPAHAVTTVPLATSPFSLANPSGVVPSGTMVSGTGTYDFTFSTIGGTYNALMQLQMTNTVTGGPRDLTFELFSGSPGSGVALAPSAGVASTPTLLATLAPGSYYMEVNISKEPVDLVTGGVTLFSSNIPEPAAWTTMILGFGLMGLAARRRRAMVAA